MKQEIYFGSRKDDYYFTIIIKHSQLVLAIYHSFIYLFIYLSLYFQQ